ncbi:MAG: hypothetical protein MPN21_08465 [Thermoanaerobaculia bacterium]|nr:hypothetical protein [Thermoanaerobaculia bacterium]
MNNDFETAPDAAATRSGRPFRRRVGGDLHVTNFPGDPDRLWLDTGFPVEGWHGRPPSRPGRPDFPGTPIRIEHRSNDLRWSHEWWEISATRIQDDARGTERFVYELRPWPEGQILRQGVELSSETARRLTLEHRAAARRRAESDRAALFMPFFGLLPAPDQEEIESRHGLPPGRATMLTALPLLLLSVYGVLLAFAANFGLVGDDVSLLAKDFRYLLGYLGLESAVRLAMGLLGQPVGSALVVVPLATLRALAPSRGSDEQLPAAPGEVPRGSAAWLEATDVVKRLPPNNEGRERLEVLSPLPKDHWRAQVDLIYHADVPYLLEERREVPGGHSFFLEAPPPGVRKTRAVHHYHPSEVREVYKEERRLKAEAWLETLAPLVGFTEPQLQLELAEFTNYKPYRGVLQSILFALLFGFLSLRTGWAMFEGAEPADHLAFLGLGVVMVWENVVRAIRLRRGEITPSFLGRLVSPFARKALRWRPDPSWPYPPKGSESA